MTKIESLAKELRQELAEFLKENKPKLNTQNLSLTTMLELYRQINPKENRNYIIYTDGGYSMQKNVGAGAFVILKNGEIVRKGGEKVENASNNIAELTAIRAALETLLYGDTATVRSDSQYAIGILSKNWKAKANKELVEEIRRMILDKDLNIIFEWVKGHSGEKYNDMCDKLCDTIAGCDLNTEYNKYKK